MEYTLFKAGFFPDVISLRSYCEIITVETPDKSESSFCVNPLLFLASLSR